MLKLQEFAKQQGVTDRQVQRLVKKYESSLLKGHIDRRGSNGTWLDDEACEILRSRMKEKPVGVYKGADDEYTKQLEAENKQLLVKVAAQADQIAELSTWKSDMAVEIAKVETTRLALEEKTAQLEQVPERIQTAVNDAEEKLKEQFNEDKAKLKAHYDEEMSKLRAELQAEKDKGFFAKLFGK